MCLVEIEKSPKPWHGLPDGTGMKVYTNSPVVKKARGRDGVPPPNHPLDC